MIKKYDKLVVCPEFRMLIKDNAAQNNKTIIEYTRDIAKNENWMDELFRGRNGKK